jgi:hypothetical protein
VKRLLLQGVVNVTTGALLLADAWLWPQLWLAHCIEAIRSWAWTKLQNMEGRSDGD